MQEINLQLGDTGDYVKILQEKLKILGFYNALITGSFGLSTEVGVKAFQKEYGLNTDGVVGVITWDTLYKVSVDEPKVYYVIETKDKSYNCYEEISPSNDVIRFVDDDNNRIVLEYEDITGIKVSDI